jgi:long-chain acyl-CoA synthetase
MTETVLNLGAIANGVAGDRIACIDLRGDATRTVTYDELRAEMRAVARGLMARGITAGDRVGILALNRSEYLAAVFGALLAGVVPVPLNIKLPLDVLTAVLRGGGVKLVFVEAAYRDLVPEGIPVVDLDGDYSEFLDFGPFEPVKVGPRTVSMQLYTSGSTGLPKGVLLTHAGQCWAADILVRYRRLQPEDRAILAAPLYHMNALVATKTSLLCGSCLVIMPRFEVGAYVESIESCGVNMLTGVPTMMRLLLNYSALPNLEIRKTVRVLSMGSSPASDRLLAELTATFPQAEMHLNYGTTEGGPIMFGWYHPAGLKRPAHSVGYPLPGCEWKLTGGSDDQGELWVRNPGVALGYLDRPDVTAERFVDGWYKTGDILRHDKDGWFYFVSRADDMMVSGGENIFPIEVETLLETHAAVRQAAVIAVPHEIKGEVPVAFVVMKDGASIDEAMLKNYVLANGPAYAHPRRVFFLEQLPLSATNKIDKAALKAIMAAEQKSARTTPTEAKDIP